MLMVGCCDCDDVDIRVVYDFVYVGDEFGGCVFLLFCDFICFGCVDVMICIVYVGNLSVMVVSKCI